MSPLLFLQYINDMLKHIKHILNNQLFADVTTVYRQITTAEKSGFSFTIGCWMGMSFHPKKFHLLIFYKNRTDMCHSYDIRDHTLERVAAAKYRHTIRRYDMERTLRPSPQTHTTPCLCSDATNIRGHPMSFDTRHQWGLSWSTAGHFGAPAANVISTSWNMSRTKFHLHWEFIVQQRHTTETCSWMEESTSSK